MRKSKTTKKKTSAKSRRKPRTAAKPSAESKKTPREEICVFAFRLTPEERTDIHKAAGPAKASKFVRTLAVAAARNDEATVKAILKAVQSET